nr:hypothetical protein [Lachnospiraceae bacterium]
MKMEMKRAKRLLGILIAFALTFLGVTEGIAPLVYSAEKETASQEELLDEKAEQKGSEESINEDTLKEEAPSEDRLSEEAVEEGLEEGLSLEEYLESDAAAYTITFVKDDAELWEDAKDYADKRDDLSIDEKGIVTQTFSSTDSESELAPILYTKAGKAVRKTETFSCKVTETYKYWVEGDGSAGSGHYEYGTRIVTKYVDAGTKVSDIKSYAKINNIELIPNWVDANIVFDTESLKGAKNPNYYPWGLYYEAGDKLELDPCTEGLTEDLRFSLWTCSFGGGTESKVPSQSVDGSKKYIIDTSGKTGTLKISAVWKPLSYKITYEKSQEQLNKFAGESIEIKEESKWTDNGQTWTASIRNKGYTALSDLYGMIGWSFNTGGSEGEDEYFIPITRASDITVLELVDMMDLKGIDSDTGEITLYAVWGNRLYNISYVGIDSKNLPWGYSKSYSTTLPTAEEVNKGEIDPEFSEKKNFICWSLSKDYKDEVTEVSVDTIGSGEGGDVTLYTIFESKNMISQVEDHQQAFADAKIKQINSLRLFDKKDYAVFYLSDANTQVDPDSISIAENDYFELCSADSLKAVLGNGYATVGIKVKDGVDFSKFDEIKKASVTLKYKFLDEKEEREITTKIKLDLKMPVFTFIRNKGTIYEKLRVKDDAGNEEPAIFYLDEKSGKSVLTVEKRGGEWETDYVDAKKNKVDKVSVALTEDNLIKIENTGYVGNGYIRIRNTDWIDGVYCYSKFNFLKKEDSDLELTPSNVKLNSSGDDKAEVLVSFKDGVNLDPAKVKVEPKDSLPEGVEYTYDDTEGVITVTCKKGTSKTNSIALLVSYDGLDKKPKKLTVKIDNKASQKPVTFKAGGKIDGLAGGNIFLTPTIKGYSGKIKSVDIIKEEAIKGTDPNGENLLYQAKWDGEYIKISDGNSFVPNVVKTKVTLEITLDTGVKLTGDYVVAPIVMKPTVKVLNTTTYNKKESDDGKVNLKAITPVIVVYDYNYYLAPKRIERRLYTFDMTDPDSNYSKDGSKFSQAAGFVIAEECMNIKGVATGTYKDGIISMIEDEDFAAKAKK